MEQHLRSPRPPRPTSRDVAALAGVSQSTVSYVMSGKRTIKAETRKRVEDAMAQLFYQPNAGARALRGRSASVIALMVRLTEHADVLGTVPYIEAVVSGARDRDYDVVLVTTDDGKADLVRLASRSICDAFVLMDIKAHDDRIPTAAGLDRPVILMGTPEDAMGVAAIDFDARKAAELMIDELVHTGHRHIAVIGETPDTPIGEFRFITEFHAGCIERARLRSVECDIIPRRHEGWRGIESITEQLLSNQNGQLGIITRTPQVTEWILHLLRLQNLAPGRDVSVVSLCTDATAKSFEVPVTNVSPEPRLLSRLAMEVLFDQLEGRISTLKTLVPPSALVRRSSTANFVDQHILCGEGHTSIVSIRIDEIRIDRFTQNQPFRCS